MVVIFLSLKKCTICICILFSAFLKIKSSYTSYSNYDFSADSASIFLNINTDDTFSYKIHLFM